MVDRGQILVIAVFAIVVLGPQKTLQLAFRAGKLWGKAQSYLNSLKSELEREGSNVQNTVNDFKHLAKTVATAPNSAVKIKRFTVSPPQTPLSCAKLQEEIDSLRQEIQRLNHKNKRVVKRSLKVRRPVCGRIPKA